jgi:hypothetical protein
MHLKIVHVGGIEVPEERGVVHPAVLDDALSVAAELLVTEYVVVLTQLKLEGGTRSEHNIVFVLYVPTSILSPASSSAEGAVNKLPKTGLKKRSLQFMISRGNGLLGTSSV